METEAKSVIEAGDSILRQRFDVTGRYDRWQFGSNDVPIRFPSQRCGGNRASLNMFDAVESLRSDIDGRRRFHREPGGQIEARLAPGLQPYGIAARQSECAR